MVRSAQEETALVVEHVTTGLPIFVGLIIRVPRKGEKKNSRFLSGFKVRGKKTKNVDFDLVTK